MYNLVPDDDLNRTAAKLVPDIQKQKRLRGRLIDRQFACFALEFQNRKQLCGIPENRHFAVELSLYGTRIENSCISHEITELIAQTRVFQYERSKPKMLSLSKTAL